MAQILEKTRKEILIKFIEVEKKVDDSKVNDIKAKLLKVKRFAKKHENKVCVSDVKNKIDAQSYGINFRNF